MSYREFRFKVSPGESLAAREARWDRELSELHAQGLDVLGVGPDGDYPVRYAFAADGTMSFEDWWKGNVDEPWFEVYDVKPLPTGQWCKVTDGINHALLVESCEACGWVREPAEVDA